MRYVFVVAGLTLALMASPSRAEQFVRIGSGLAGTYPVFGAKLAELINKHVPDARASAVSGGTEQNLVRIQKGEAEMAITYTFQAAQSAAGKGDLNFPTPDLRHVMSLYGSYFIPIARKDLDIANLSDVKRRGLRVWFGTKASVFYPLIVASFGAHGVAMDDISKAGGVINTMGYQNTPQAFQDNQIDVTFMSGPVPYSILMQIDRAPGFRAIGFDEAAGRRMMELLPGVSMATHKGGVYQNAPQPVSVPYLFNQMVIGAKVPEPVVYRITKMMNEQVKEFHALFAGAEEIQPSTALKDNKLPLHPGAERYYREVGLLK